MPGNTFSYQKKGKCNGSTTLRLLWKMQKETLEQFEGQRGERRGKFLGRLD